MVLNSECGPAAGLSDPRPGQNPGNGNGRVFLIYMLVVRRWRDFGFGEVPTRIRLDL